MRSNSSSLLNSRHDWFRKHDECLVRDDLSSDVVLLSQIVDNITDYNVPQRMGTFKFFPLSGFILSLFLTVMPLLRSFSLPLFWKKNTQFDHQSNPAAILSHKNKDTSSILCVDHSHQMFGSDRP